MILTLNPPLVVVLGTLLGIILGYFVRQIITRRQINTAETRAQNLLNEAKGKGQEILLDAKNKALQILDDSKKDQEVRQSQLLRIEKMLSKKERELEQTSRDTENEKKNLKAKVEEVGIIKADLEQKRQGQVQILEKLSGLKKTEAKDLLIKTIEDEHKEEIYQKLRELEQENKEQLEKKAQEIITTTIQRYAKSHIAEITTTVVSLPSDEIKGKIIGKEGRNIKTIERLTGVDIIIDETPETIILSSFDPVRRQIAKSSIEKLIADGRIHPARIEEVVEKSKQEIDQKIKEAGEAALYETGVGLVDPKLTYLLGRLAFRTSFGQNMLIHSIETSFLSGMLASELGADVGVAKKAGLFHDIGKAIDQEVQGTHVEIGKKILQKFNIDEKVINAMQAHHEEYPYTSIESRIIQAADAISSSRPGARRDTVEAYLKRLDELEKVANTFEGVEKSYAVQAGRELRIFVFPSKMDDLGALKLAKDVAKKIEEQMDYPGEIKVNVIRETRAIEYAR